MIIVLSQGHVNPAKLTPYLEAVRGSGVIESTRQEAGCLHYEIAASALHDGNLSIMEIWEGFPGLQGHMKSESLAKMTKINEKYDVSYVSKLYNAEAMG